MLTKIQIKGNMEILTGLHIGTSAQFAAIGAVDSPVMRDVISDLPLIPGSSLKGKMRYLMAREYSENIQIGKHSDDPEIVLRIFGCSEDGKRKPCRLQFSDMILVNKEELEKKEVYSPTEVKFENTINRLTAIANPRQIERVIRGTRFDLNLLYTVEKEDEIKEDFEAIAQGFKLLQYDYLGGHGSRGYGKVKFSDLKAQVVIGRLKEETLLEECDGILKGVIG